ncbi:FctA domain-containing protein [Collinsella sp. An2]|uniref:Spy0128 family protein n=1 Tax=Collinsella sp. An2 TaxID=1965585 RepID=UPI000B39D3DF|nr:FctA domain-containing protein [Collinsella sp. An2]OUP09189.1 hypothetical protein B5F33_05510 [Collinsella sp. An2]
MGETLRRTVGRLFATLAVLLLAVTAFSPGKAFAAEVTDEAGFIAAIEAGGDVTVTGDIELKQPVTVKKDVTLNGTGTIKLADSFEKGESLAPLAISEGATLTIDGVTLDGNQQDCNYGADTGSMIYVGGSLDLKSGSIANVINSGSATGRGVVYVADGGHFIMEGGSIADCQLTGGNYQGIVYVAPGSVFDFSDGTISGCYVKDPQGASGVVSVKNGTESNGVLNMSGGSISNNDSCGLYIGSNSDLAHPGKVNLSGGEICNNTYGDSYYAGGVYIVNGDLEMTGGTISGNEGQFYGGGIALVANPTAKFNMTGGTISGNKSMYGAGVYLTGIQNTDWACDVELSGGRIENNVASRQGGGIYVVRGQEVNLKNVVVTGNNAEKIGGGIWTCSTGDMRVYVTNGGAVFGNTASGDETGSAGADLAFVKHDDDEGIQDFSIAMRALGGGRVTYYNDGGVYATNDKGEGLDGTGMYYLGVSDGTPRYDASNPGDAVTDVNVAGQSYALVSSMSEDAQAVANNNAKLIITGNQANRGAGVGANGSVIIGTAPSPETGVTEHTLTVKKVWEGVSEDATLPEVEVALVSDGYQLDTVNLNQENGWTAQFTNLPEGEYAVKELTTVEGYTSTVGDTVTGEDGNYTVTITNTKNSEPSPEPGGGTTPTPTPTTPADVTISADKVLKGADLKAGQFTFQLVDETGKVIATATNDANGNVTFPEQTFKATGEHTYVVSEVLPTDDDPNTPGVQKDGITYDEATYKVVVTVTKSGTKYVAKVTGNNATFTNVYDTTGTTVTVGAKKELQGGSLEAGQFTFELKDEAGSVLATVTNAADGSFAFPVLEYKKAGAYHYTLAEVNDGQEGVTYDGAVFDITVTVTDNGKGELSAQYTVQKHGESTYLTDLPTFVNVYTPTAEPPVETTTPSGPTLPHTGDMVPFVVGIVVVAGAALIGVSLYVKKHGA